MIACLIAALWLLSGICLLSPCAVLADVEVLCGAFPLGMVASTTLLWGVASAWGLSAVTAILSSLTAFSASALWGAAAVRRRAWRRPALRPLLLGAIAAAPVLYLHVMLFDCRDGAWVMWMSPHTDIVVHACFTAVMAQGGGFPPSQPLCAGTPFSYHALVDLASASLMLGGAPLAVALAGVDAVCSIACLAMVALLARACGLRRAGTATAVILVALAGGVGAFIELARAPADFFVTLTHQPLDTLPDDQIVFTSLLRDHLLHARTPAPALTLWLLASRLLLGDKPYQARSATGTDRCGSLLAGACVGLLPLVNVHIFAGASAVLMTWALLQRGSGWGWVALAYSLIACPLVWLAWHHSVPLAGALRLSAGWLPGAPLLTFWLRNVGLVFILGPLGTLLFPPRSAARCWFVAAWAAWGIGNTVILTTSWANERLMLVWFIPTCVAAAAAVERLARGGKAARVAAAVTVAAAIFSGVASLAVNLTSGVVVADREQQTVARWLHDETPVGSVVLCGDDDIAAVVALGGRPAFVGYLGRLETFGPPPLARDEVRKSVWDGDAAAVEALDGGGVDYVVRSPAEYDIRTQPALARAGWVLCFSTSHYEIYRRTRSISRH